MNKLPIYFSFDFGFTKDTLLGKTTRETIEQHISYFMREEQFVNSYN
jgi:hypothetical protein